MSIETPHRGTLKLVWGCVSRRDRVSKLHPQTSLRVPRRYIHTRAPTVGWYSVKMPLGRWMATAQTVPTHIMMVM